MDMASLFRTKSGTLPNHTRDPPMSTVQGPLIWLILTEAHIRATIRVHSSEFRV